MIPRGKSLGGVAYANGKWVAVGGDSELLTSTNAAKWQTGVLPPARFITDAAYGNGKCVAVGSVTNQLGVAMTSTNGSDWTTNVTGDSRLNACAFGNGMFVSVGNGTLLSSADAVNWTSRRPSNAWVFFGVDFIGDQFIALGGAGLTTSSPDGINWSAPTTDNGPDLRAAAFGDGTTVVVGAYQRIKTTSATASADSWDWQSEVSFWDVAYGNGRFVAVGFLHAFGFGVIYASTNGFDWDRPVFGETSSLYRVAFANGEFVTVGAQGVVLTSTNGLNWTLRRGGIPAPLMSVAAGGDAVVAIAGAYSAVAAALRSSGDQTWQIQPWGYNNGPTRILYTNGQFLAVGSGGIASSSSDGIQWTHRMTGISAWLNDVIFAQDTYIAVGNNFGGGGTLGRSSDGITWSNQNFGLNKGLFGVAYGNGRFVAVGEQGVALSSLDAIVWTHEATGNTNWLRKIAFGKDSFVAVGQAGTIIRSSNGEDWSPQNSQTTSDLNGVRYLAGRFIALGDNGTILSSIDGSAWQTHASGVVETLYDAAVAENRIWVVGSATVLMSKHGVYPVLQPTGWGETSGFMYRLPMDIGRPCRLQGSSDFVTWQDLGAIILSATNQVHLDFSATNAPMRFYRVLAE